MLMSIVVSIFYYFLELLIPTFEDIYMFKFLDTSELGNGAFCRVQNVFYSEGNFSFVCMHLKTPDCWAAVPSRNITPGANSQLWVDKHRQRG